MTRLYLDTEFNGFGGELISLALVQTNGPHFYGISSYPVKIDPWVAEHVMPVLARPIFHPTSVLPARFRSEMHGFLGQFRNPEIICDWHADAAHFFVALAGKDFGSSLDYPCRLVLLSTPVGEPVSDVPHNALADAISLMKWNEMKAAA